MIRIRIISENINIYDLMFLNTGAIILHKKSILQSITFVNGTIKIIRDCTIEKIYFSGLVLHTMGVFADIACLRG